MATVSEIPDIEAESQWGQGGRKQGFAVRADDGLFCVEAEGQQGEAVANAFEDDLYGLNLFLSVGVRCSR